jgi:hypothetical protein
MFRSPFQLIRSRVALAAVTLAAAALPAISRADDNRAPEAPVDIQVPEGNKVHFQAYAEGVQIYTWDGASWGASVPEAMLYDRDGDIVGIHYGGPSWESASGSKVMAAVAAPRITVDPTAIPWLLLKSTSTEGSGVFAATSYIQRVNTTGGKAPAVTGSMVGEVARVPYTANYYFYRQAND